MNKNSIIIAASAIILSALSLSADNITFDSIDSNELNHNNHNNNAHLASVSEVVGHLNSEISSSLVRNAEDRVSSKTVYNMDNLNEICYLKNLEDNISFAYVNADEISF